MLTWLSETADTMGNAIDLILCKEIEKLADTIDFEPLCKGLETLGDAINTLSDAIDPDFLCQEIEKLSNMLDPEMIANQLITFATEQPTTALVTATASCFVAYNLYRQYSPQENIHLESKIEKKPSIIASSY